jgi:HAD superfamily hydrolase (TIGR01549 family)
MQNNIEAICFDIGGTLRITKIMDDSSLNYIQRIQSFIGVDGDPQEFLALLRSREKKYRHWCKRNLVELSEADLWSMYMLPDIPSDFVRKNAVILNQMWRSTRNKSLLPDAVETLKTLASRGYTLAVISNTTSSTETPDILAENGISDLFQVVILSTTFGLRKPHPSLFVEASRAMRIPPERCAYIGDSLTRDLIGARQAGYGSVTIINVNGYYQDEYDPDDDTDKEIITEIRPDHRIGKLGELLKFFPQRTTIHKQETSIQPLKQPDVLYDAALSTMWGVDQPIPFNDTFSEARRIGFCRFELNHKVSKSLFRQFDSNQFYISTIHEPCPTTYSYDERKSSDIEISSLDESLRLRAIDMIKKSIDLACKLGSKSVVIHPGAIAGDHTRDYRLRQLFKNGQKGSPTYENLKAEAITHRAQEVAPYLERVMQSLTEIVEYAKGTHIALALENRYRYYDIPLPDEMGKLLDLGDEEWFGFQYDTGHAQTLDVLGFVDGQEWLNRFSHRMIGVHLHDVIGITDHQVPGCGDIDFKKIAAFIPKTALRTIEVGPQASLSELAAGAEVLAESGCIERI